MKKGRHRRFEEARAMKRSQDVDLDALFDSLRTDDSPSSASDISDEDDEDWVDEDDDDER